MKIYLGGGVVRDELMGRVPKDRDFVVIGSTPAEMIALGYEQVGADFPVFLKNGEEYALARTERKTGKGYNGFTTEFDSSITLEDDLRRRDLTINAMAKDLDTGEIIDPFNGLQDLHNGVLRHVSPAFSEDPLRVLRVARLRARYGFKIAHDTTELMQKLVHAGELDHLTPERVWTEIEKGFSDESPVAFITTLMVVDAWGKLFPNVRVGGVFHRLRSKTDLSFDHKLMLLFSDTDSKTVRETLEKYRASADSIHVVMNFKHFQGCVTQGVIGSFPTNLEVLQMLKRLDAFRRPDVFYSVMQAAVMHSNLFQIADIVLNSFEMIKDVSFSSLTVDDQKLRGADIGRAIDAERLKRLDVNTA